MIYFVFLSLVHFCLYAQEIGYYEEAKKIEKVSSFFSIVVYEKSLETEPQYKSQSLAKLFDLYLVHAKLEDLILLKQNNVLDKTREEKYLTLKKNLANNIGIDYDRFEEFLEVVLNKNSQNRKKLLNIYAEEKNAILLNYIFALKYKIQDYESLGYLISEAPDMNPTLRLAYLIKTHSREIENKFRDFAKISDLSDEQRMELLFLYGHYLQKKRKYKQSARFFRMSASYDTKKSNYIPIGIVETAKALFILGKANEGCSFLKGKKIFIQNEADAFIEIYCTPKKSKNLAKLELALKLLSEQESGLIFRAYFQKYIQGSAEKDE